MNIVQAVESALSQYASTAGRARRSEFWYWQLATTVIGFAVGLFAGYTGARALVPVYELAVLLPSVGIAGRRLHDTGRSAWWVLLNVIPMIGWIVLIVWYCLDSKPANPCGPSSKDDDASLSYGGAYGAV